MIVTYNWLKEFVDFEMTPEALADLLTMLGLEVEGMRSVGADMDSVIVAVVQERQQHPNADKLSLCKVDTGSEVLQIVCGAQNFTAGDKVALARVGAVLPGDFRIKKSKIRGVESFGMLCSEKELGLAEESEGIMILPPELSHGLPLFDALGLKDTIFEIGLTPNRADCLSTIGIAREIAAKLGRKLKAPGHVVTENGPPAAELVTVRIDDPDLCPRYSARYISGCTIGPSPAWMVNRLNAVGMRSVNNVVDITNYVLMEYGHPLHAFDYHLLDGGEIIVRRAAEDESFKTLDGQERILSSADLTIRDSHKAIALAGIMGGENSEIKDSTTDILIESACFAPTAIRRTAKRLGMHTESSHRFERGADIEIVTRALDRAASLMADLAGGKVAQGTVDVYPRHIPPRTITVRVERVSQLLGIQLTSDEVGEIFRNLEFLVEQGEPGCLTVTVPTFRIDIEREIDLIEEVARLNGYENIPATMPKVRIFSDRPSRHLQLEKRLRNILVSHGLSEVVTYSFIHPDSFDRILIPEDDPRRSAIRVLNPLTEDQSVMRTTLLPGLLETAARNVSFRLHNLKLFEMRRVYLPEKDRELPNEPVYAAGILSGVRDPEGWNRSREMTDFYDVKGLLENVFDEFSLPEACCKSVDIENYYHPGKSCSVYIGNERLGSFGELHPALQESYSIEYPVYFFELNFEKLAAFCREGQTVSPPPRYPDTFRDIALLIQEEIETGQVIECIKKTKIKEMETVEVFDVYAGSNIPQGHRSVAVRVRYRSVERTLTDEEVNRMHQRVMDSLLEKINVSVR